MLDKLTAVLLYGPADQWQSIMGRLPDAPALSALSAMAQPRSAARKQGQGLAISVPMSAERWLFWILAEVPSASELAAVMSRLQEITSGLDRVGGIGSVTPAVTGPAPSGGTSSGAQASELLRRIKAGFDRAERPKRAALAAAILDQLVELGAMDGGAIVEWRDAKTRKVWLSDNRYKSHAREIGLLASSLRGPSAVSVILGPDSTAEHAMEATLLARQFDSGSLGFVAPRQGTSGAGVVAFGAKSEALDTLAAAGDLFSLIQPTASARTEVRRWVRRAIAAALLAGLGVWLALPAPLAITATGEAQAADVTVIALPTDGYLSKVHVRNGDSISQGTPIADFSSPQLEDALAEERLKASVEQLNAQVALAENKYSDYQIAVQRSEIAATLIAQLSDRIASLSIQSPVSGTVLNAIPESVTGAYSRTGQEIAAIQTSDRMLVKMALERLDARLVSPGMQGTVFFRGLANREFALSILTPATVVIDSKTGQERIEAIAELIDSEGVIAGMSGIISLDGDPAPRFVSYGRYAYEFLREKSWTYLGLKF